MTMGDARHAAERVARVSYGRLVALIAVRSRDVAAAEDALSGAFAAALATWPVTGIPDAPEAWLLTAARRSIGHAERHGRVRDATMPTLALLQEKASAQSGSGFPDERLKLLFVCAHPAIDPAIRTPLMLQAVLGIEAARIAAAFIVPPATMSQRLVRAKAKIRDAGIAFETPDIERLTDRLADVLAAIYAAYGTAWDHGPAAGGLSGEAIFLARLVVALLPSEPEARGLLALLLYCDARRDARRSADGRFVPLAEQDRRLWSRDLIIEAEGLLTQASRAGRFGRFQCEAAIQSVHCQRAVTGRTNWQALLVLYDMLAERAPTLGVLVARAAVTAEAGLPDRALAAIDTLPADPVARYQPYWVTRARILELAGRGAEAALARSRAIGLTDDAVVRDFLLRGA